MEEGQKDMRVKPFSFFQAGHSLGVGQPSTGAGGCCPHQHEEIFWKRGCHELLNSEIKPEVGSSKEEKEPPFKRGMSVSSCPFLPGLSKAFSTPAQASSSLHRSSAEPRLAEEGTQNPPLIDALNAGASSAKVSAQQCFPSSATAEVSTEVAWAGPDHKATSSDMFLSQNRIIELWNDHLDHPGVLPLLSLLCVRWPWSCSNKFLFNTQCEKSEDLTPTLKNLVKFLKCAIEVFSWEKAQLWRDSKWG